MASPIDTTHTEATVDPEFSEPQVQIASVLISDAALTGFLLLNVI